MSQDRPLVSIMTPTFNSEDFLGDLLELVDVQTYDNIEHVIVDGASTDGTVDLIKKYAEDHRVNWISEPDENNIEAINKGLKMVSGDIIVIIPSDDLIFPWTIQTIVDYFLTHPEVEVVHGDSLVLDVPSGSLHLRIHKRFTFGYMARTQCLVPAAMYIRRHVLQGNEVLDNTLPHACDYDWIMRLTRNRKVVNIKEFLMIFRKYPWAINNQQGAVAQTARESEVARTRFIKTSGLTHWLMAKWDRLFGALHRRVQLVRLVRLSKAADKRVGGLKKGSPWFNYLTAYSLSDTSKRDLLKLFLPGRSNYDLKIWSRDGALSLGAAAHPKSDPNDSN